MTHTGYPVNKPVMKYLSGIPAVATTTACVALGAMRYSQSLAEWYSA
jgi:hypothetical protein